MFTDEKEKYDPSSFRDAIIQGLTETDNDLEQVNNTTIRLKRHISQANIRIRNNTNIRV
jgi:hypothetical protein